MIRCSNCESINVRVSNGNLPSVKPEGQPSAMCTYNRNLFYCRNCENKWESIPEAEQDYSEYIQLCYRTRIVSRDLKRDGGYGPALNICPEELSQQKDLAKKIVSTYKHVLNIDCGEWHDIEQDAL